jgi:hypothetical protein
VNMHLIFMFLQVLPTLTHVSSVAVVTKMIIISNYSCNKICDEHIVDMLLPLNIIDGFVISRLVDIKRLKYKDFTHLRIYYTQVLYDT